MSLPLPYLGEVAAERRIVARLDLEPHREDGLREKGRS